MTEPVHGGEVCLIQESGRLLRWRQDWQLKRSCRAAGSRRFTQQLDRTLTPSHQCAELTCAAACCTLGAFAADGRGRLWCEGEMRQ